MYLSFTDEEECRLELKRRLNLDTEETAALHIENALIDLFEVREESKEDEGFSLRLRNWVIRPDDLKLLETLKTTLIAFASANFVISQVPVSGLTSIAIGLLEILWKSYRKGAHITSQQVQVMALLEQATAPVFVGDLVKYLQIVKGEEWTEALVREVLSQLQQVHSRSGLISFVESTSDNRWCLAER